MSLRKGTTGARFQVSLETYGPLFVRELDNNVIPPRAMFHGMRTAPSIVIFESTMKIRSEAHIEMCAVALVLHNINETFAARHTARRGNRHTEAATVDLSAISSGGVADSAFPATRRRCSGGKI